MKYIVSNNNNYKEVYRLTFDEIKDMTIDKVIGQEKEYAKNANDMKN